MNMKKILKNGAAAVLSQLIAVIYGFVLPRLILEYFGSEVNGLTQSIKQFLSVISFLDLGVGQVLRTSLYRPLAENNADEISCVMASGRKFYRRLAWLLVGYAAALICIYPMLMARQFGFAYTSALIAVMAISSFAQYYFGIANEQLLQADQRGYVISGLQSVSNLLNLLLCIVLLRMERSIHEVKLAASIVFLIKPVVMVFVVRRRYSIDRCVKYTHEPIVQKWNGVAQHLSAVVLDGTDMIVLTLFSTLTNVSVYSVYYMVVASIQHFYYAATAGIQSAAGALWARCDLAAVEKMFARTEKWLHLIVVFVFSCIGLLIVPFVQVYTAGLNDAEYVQPLFAVILVLAYGMRCLRTPYNIWILAAGHYKQTQSCHMTAVILNLGISIAAVHVGGLIGVAVGTLAAMVYQTVWMAVYTARHLLKRPLTCIGKQLLADILMTAVICLFTRGISLEQLSYAGWLSMAVRIAVVAAGVVFVSALLLCRQDLQAVCKRLRIWMK